MTKSHIFLALKWITKLIQSTDLDTDKNIFCHGVTMFGIEYKNLDFNDTVKEVLKELLPEDTELDCADDRTQDEFIYVVETQKYCHSSPHWAYFNKATENALNKCREKGEFVENQKLGDKYQKKNPYWQQNFLDYVLEYLMPYFSLWSASIICRLNILRDSNAKVENYFKWVKNELGRKKINNKAPRFIMSLEELVDPRLKQIEFSSITTRQSRNRYEREEENLLYKKSCEKRCKGRSFTS